MEYLYFIKNESIKEYYFVEIIPNNEGLISSNPYNKEIKDEYIYYDYSLILSEPFFEKDKNKIKIETKEQLLDENKYYLCCKDNQLGFRKPYQSFIKVIQDKESNRDIKTKINLDIRCKLMDLLIKEKMLNLTI